MGFVQTEFATLTTRETLKDRSTWGRIGLVKRSIDVFISLTALIFLAPVFLVATIAVKLTSKGTIFYMNKRVGYDGKVFNMYKFRTMHTNAEDILQDLLKKCPKTKAQWDKYQKLENDPRITRVGAFLRKSSIDELPQLVNVLLGTMSIVGPRPLLIGQDEIYGKANLENYVRLRPGITGAWQVNGRSAITFEKRLDIERYYYENWSNWYDIKIIVKTVPAVLFPKAAY